MLLLLACAPDPVPAYAVPDGATAGWYEPLVSLTTFPDDVHLLETPDGRQVQLQGQAGDDLHDQLPDDFTLIEALEELDGWGLAAGTVLRFTGPLDPTTVTTDTVQLVRLSDGAPLDVELELTDDDATIIATPLFPLEPETAYGVAVAGVTDAEGGQVYPSVDLYGMLVADPEQDPLLQRVHGRYAALKRATGWHIADIQAATVFTTQSLGDEEAAMAEEVAGTSPTLHSLGCTDEGDVISCEATVEVLDFLGDDHLLADPTAQQTYTLPVSIWLPSGQEGPFPVVIYGHGLGGKRSEGKGVARNLAAAGLAVASVDAPSHHEHPAGSPDEDFFWVFDFFGIDAYEQSFEVRRLRDGWRRAAFDKLQLAIALRAGPDLTGDGQADLEPSPMGYAGHSLGGIMGPQLLALDPEITAAELATPGGRVTEIVHRGEIFAPMIALMAPEGTSQGEVDRFFPMLQTAVERGDAVNHVAAILDGERDLLLTQVLDDDIIPNACTRVLARAAAVQHAEPHLQAVEGLDSAGALPLSENLEGRTGVLYQFDEMVDDGVLQDATHTHIHGSDSGVDQYLHFWQTWLDTGVAEVIDPMVNP